jgi:hypothetical protein
MQPTGTDITPSSFLSTRWLCVSTGPRKNTREPSPFAACAMPEMWGYQAQNPLLPKSARIWFLAVAYHIEEYGAPDITPRRRY